MFLDNTDHFDAFQPRSRPDFAAELVLVALMDDPYRKEQVSATVLVLLNLTVTFDASDHCILLDCLCGMCTGYSQ